MNLKKLLLMYVLILGLVFTFAVPPFQKPDEIYHYFHTYSSAFGGCKSFGNDGYMELPKDVYDFPFKLLADKIPHEYETKFPIATYKSDYINTSGSYEKYERSCTRYGFVSYLPNIIGLKIGGNNLMLGFFMSRFMGFIFFLFLFGLSLKLAGKYQSLFLSFSVIPMVIHQVSSVSYDSFHISLGLLVFGYYIDIFKGQKIVKTRNLLLFMCILLAFVMTKSGYYLFLLLPLMYFSRAGLKKVKRNTFLLNIMLIVLFYGLSFFLIKQSIGYVEKVDGRFVNISIQSQLVLDDPAYFIKTLQNTIKENAYFYWISFLADFGALDYQPHFSVYLLISFLVVFIIAKIRPEKEVGERNLVFNIIEIGLLFVIIFGTVLAIELSLYLIWTPVAENTITGVQGRYFLILFPYFAYMVVKLIRLIGKKAFEYGVCVVCLSFIVVNIGRSVYLRYFDFSKTYSNIEEMNFGEGFSDTAQTGFNLLPVSSNLLCQEITNPDTKYGGFKVYFFKESEDDIVGVFKYEIIIGGKTVFSGYLDVNKIQSKGKYVQDFNKILTSKNGDKDICLKIDKKNTEDDSNVLNYLTKDDISVVFLKIAN